MSPNQPSSQHPSRSDLGLTDELLREIIGRSIGVPNGPLPVRVERSLELIGLFRAKQLAFELLLAVRDVRLAVKRMRIKLATRETTDDDWGLIQYEYSEVWTERDRLRTRIDEDCGNWRQYTEIAVPIYRGLDQFCAAVRLISQGYKPKSMRSPDDADFLLEPPLQEFVQKVDFYNTAIESVWMEFGGWLRDCDALYAAHCHLLDRQP